MGSLEELPQCAYGRTVSVKLGQREPVFVVRPAEVREFSQQLVNDLRVHRILDAGGNTDVTLIETNLPLVGRRNHHIATDQFTPLHVIAECRREQAYAIAALLKNLVSLLEDRH